jgi:hypothetical protein
VGNEKIQFDLKLDVSDAEFDADYESDIEQAVKNFSMAEIIKKLFLTVFSTFLLEGGRVEQLFWQKKIPDVILRRNVFFYFLFQIIPSNL